MQVNVITFPGKPLQVHPINFVTISISRALEKGVPTKNLAITNFNPLIYFFLIFSKLILKSFVHSNTSLATLLSFT